MKAQAAGKLWRLPGWKAQFVSASWKTLVTKRGSVAGTNEG